MEAVIRRTEDGIIQIVPDSAHCRRFLMSEFDLKPSFDGTIYLTPHFEVDEVQIAGMVDWLKQSMQNAGMTVHYRLN